MADDPKPSDPAGTVENAMSPSQEFNSPVTPVLPGDALEPRRARPTETHAKPGGKRARKALLGLAILLIVGGLGAGAVFAYRAYKIAQVRQEEERLVDWMKRDIMEANSVRFVTAVGDNEPNWMGDTAVFTLWDTPAGARIAVNAYIRSSVTETRIVRLELCYRGGPRIEDMTAAQLAEAFQHASGTTVNLPADIVYSGTPVDLQKELPAAFGKPAP